MSLYRKLKVRTHQIISPAKEGDRSSLFFDVFISVLILISCVSVFIEILNEGERLHHILSIIEYVSVAVFIVEYLLRMWVCDLIYPKAQSKLRAVGAYVVSFESFVDIVSIVSVVFVLIPKGFALLRLIKLIRLGHAMKLTEYIPFFHKNKDRFAKVQNRVHLILSKHGHGDRLSRAYDIFSVILIILSISFIIIETFPIPHILHSVIVGIEIFIALFFAVEYILRIWVAPLDYHHLSPDSARIQYVFSFMSLMDLLAIVPVFAANISNATGILKVFKLCKITRLIKASRYLGGIEEFSKSFRTKKKQIILSVIINSALLMICSILLHSAENNVQPDVFQNGFSGIYHCIRSALDSDHGVVALTSAGKALSALILMISACTVGVPLTIIATGFEHIVAESSSENSDSAVRRVTDLYDMLNDEQKEKVASHISSDMNTND